MKNIILISLLFLFVQCNKTEVPPIEEEINTTINGIEFTPTETNAQQNASDGLIIEITDGTIRITISTSSTEIATYTISSKKDYQTEYTATASITKDGITTTASSGTVEISSNLDNKVSGTYTFTAENIEVKNGTFTDVKISDTEIKNYILFEDEKYEISNAEHRIGSFETDATGRFNFVNLYSENIVIDENDNIEGNGIFIEFVITTDAENTSDIIGDFSRDGTWTGGDARTAPDYSFQYLEAYLIENGEETDIYYGLDKADELLITKTDNIYNILIKGNGIKVVDDVTTQGKIELNFSGEIKFIDNYVIPEFLTLGNPEFTVNLSSDNTNKILETVWTGSKLWSYTDNFSDLIEIDITNGTILQTISQSDGHDNSIGSLQYVNGYLTGTYGSLINNEADNFFIKLNTTTGDYVNRWYYERKGERIRPDSYLASNGNFIYCVIDSTIDGANKTFVAKYNVGGGFIEMAANNVWTYEYITYGGGYFWAYPENYNGFIYKLDDNLNIVASFFIDNYDMLPEVQWANEKRMYLVYIDSELWIVDLANNFYKTGIN